MSPGYSFNKSHDKYLCAFDISPFRNSLDEITEPSIIKAKYIIKFLNDIIDISQKQNLNIYLKMKRELINSIYIHKLYKKNFTYSK